MTISNLKELISRLEAAGEGSRELDRDLHLLFDLYPPGIQDIGCYFDDPAMGCADGETHTAALYTTSVDTALAIIAKVMPAWSYVVSGPRDHVFPTDDPRPQAVLRGPGGPHGPTITAAGATPAIALVSALLRSLDQS